MNRLKSINELKGVSFFGAFDNDVLVFSSCSIDCEKFSKILKVHDISSKLVKHDPQCSAELKADGARCFTDLENMQMLSRGGNTYKGLDQLQTLLSSADSKWKDYVLDGELVVDSTFAQRELGNGLLNKSLNGEIPQDDADLIRYQVWDLIPRAEYYGDVKATTTLSERRKLLLEFCDYINWGNDIQLIQPIESTLVSNVEEAKAIYNNYINLGLEGIILKNNKSVFEDRRSSSFVKFKQKIRVDVEIVATYAHKKDPTKLGGFTIKTACGKLQCNIGSGLKDKQQPEDLVFPMQSFDRKTLMTVVDLLPSRILEIEVNGLTKREGTEDYSFFLPIIKLWRDDKRVANTLDEVFERLS